MPARTLLPHAGLEPPYTEYSSPEAALISGRYVRQQFRSDRTTRRARVRIADPGFSQVHAFSLSSSPEAGIRRDDPGLLYAFYLDKR